MAAEGGKSDDFYAILGLSKECTPAELRNKYKKLAMKWHPDRVSTSGNPKKLEEAKQKFQAIQQAYSVLSDANKRFLYDVGAYDCNDDEDKSGMGDFLNEMTSMMSQTKPSGSGHESLEELQNVFEEMFQSDLEGYTSRHSSAPHAGGSSSSHAGYGGPGGAYSSSTSSEAFNASNWRGSDAAQFEGFNIGASGASGKHKSGESSRKKSSRTSRR